jgi:hypothetical protein
MQMSIAEGLLPTLSQGYYDELVQQLVSGLTRLVRFSSFLRTKECASGNNAWLREVGHIPNVTSEQIEADERGEGGDQAEVLVEKVRPHELAGGDTARVGHASGPAFVKEPELGKTSLLHVEVEMQLVDWAPATSTPPYGVPGNQAESLVPGEEGSKVEKHLVLVNLLPMPERVAQLEAQVQALEENFQYTMDLLPEIVFTKDAQVSPAGQSTVLERMCDPDAGRMGTLVGERTSPQGKGRHLSGESTKM